MTSKEAVDRIKNDDYSKRYSKNKLLNIIKKDLEVLEMFKKFSKIDKYKLLGEIKAIKITYMTNEEEEDYNKIKEWLEGE